MRDELNYKLQVEPMLHAVLNQVAIDAESLGAKPDEISRAIDSWLTNRLTEQNE